MTAYIAITDPETDPDAPLTATLAKKWRDNPIAITEGSAGAPKIQDAALDTGVATGAGQTWVALRTAGLGTGGVGTYALLRFDTLTTAAAGTTHAGSSLRYADAQGNTSGTPGGTWRLMGQTLSANAETSTSLFLRIS